MLKQNYQKFYKNLTQSPGVYVMKNKEGEMLYIGKAGNLKKRVSSYFQKAHDRRVEELMGRVAKIDYRTTDSALDALILESELIKKEQPIFNVREKDDKSFLWIEITNDEYPRVLLARGGEKDKKKKSEYFGPFVFASEAREALRILRKIFPFSVHPPNKVGTFKRFCLDAQIGICPGTCVGGVDKKEYVENIKNLKKILKGKKRRLVKDLETQMKQASKNLNFERAEKLKRQVFALKNIQDAALVNPSKVLALDYEAQPANRIECYDVSNISGTSAVGSMVVFKKGEPEKSQYRKFKIKTVVGQDDVGMLREVLERRFKRDDWPLPDIVLVDGGISQVSVAKKVLRDVSLDIPVVGIAKGPKRKKNEFIGSIPDGVDKKTLVRLRDEAHRFAVKYHRKLRDKI